MFQLTIMREKKPLTINQSLTPHKRKISVIAVSSVRFLKNDYDVIARL